MFCRISWVLIKLLWGFLLFVWVLIGFAIVRVAAGPLSSVGRSVLDGSGWILAGFLSDSGLVLVVFFMGSVCFL